MLPRSGCFFGLQTGKGFVAGTDATADAESEATVIALRLEKGVWHMMQGPGSLDSFFDKCKMHTASKQRQS
jgi:hypothetical protein